ncbi:MAG: hypothetical protein Q8L49_06675, partial [Burkholderiaceae bacterium]|nr:hypothetical protein [Burkholderiaceae bacterium]
PLEGKFKPLTVLPLAAVTPTVADWLVEPPAPEHKSVNVLAAVSAPVAALPLVALLPLHEPLAEQLVALVEDQLRVALEPLATLVGLLVSVSVGAGAGAEFPGGNVLDSPPPQLASMAQTSACTTTIAARCKSSPGRGLRRRVSSNIMLHSTGDRCLQHRNFTQRTCNTLRACQRDLPLSHYPALRSPHSPRAEPAVSSDSEYMGDNRLPLCMVTHQAFVQ